MQKMEKRKIRCIVWRSLRFQWVMFFNHFLDTSQYLLLIWLQRLYSITKPENNKTQTSSSSDHSQSSPHYIKSSQTSYTYADPPQSPYHCRTQSSQTTYLNQIFMSSWMYPYGCKSFVGRNCRNCLFLAWTWGAGCLSVEISPAWVVVFFVFSRD